MIKSSITFKEHTLPQLMQHDSGVVILVISTDIDSVEQEWINGIILTNIVKSLIGRQSKLEYLLSNCKIFTGVITLSNE